MKLFKTLLLAILAFTTFSCESDSEDEETQVTVTAPSNLEFAETAISVDFYTDGSATPVGLNWGGETGSFELASPVRGVSVNSTTGTITWDKSLPVGGNDITVIARNSAGFTSATYQIQNNFSGSFTGVYDDSIYFQITFNSDGTLIGGANDSFSPDTFAGTYMIVNGVIETNYTYDAFDETYSTIGSLTYDNTTLPTYEGTWGFNNEPTNGGTIRLELD